MSEAPPVTAVPRPPGPGPVSAAAPSEPAGEASYDELLAPLDGLAERPVDEHPAAYEQVHAGLRAVLAGEPARA